MAPHSSEITIPNVRLALEDLLGVIQSLDEPSRARVAQALADLEMDARLGDLIRELAAKAPVEELTDADLEREAWAVRRTGRSA